MYKKLSLIFVLLAFLSTTSLADTVLNIDQPIRKLNVSKEQVQQSILDSLDEQKWTVESDHDGRMIAKYTFSDYMAKVKITFASTYYTIDYYDSLRMRYKGSTIHPTYTKLIKALQSNIVRNIKRAHTSTPVEKVETVVEKQTSKKKDLKSQLAELKALQEEGILTQAEYDAKRQQIISAY